MIRVVITGPPSGTGVMPYVIDWWQHGRHQFVGVSKAPLLDACRQLKQFGLMDDTVVGLFHETDEFQWIERTTVGYGARHMGPYREFPGGPIKDAPEPIPPPSDTAGLTYVPPATPEEPPPPPRTPPEPPDDKGLEHSRPAKLEKSHHRPRPKGSGGHRGLSRGR